MEGAQNMSLAPIRSKYRHAAAAGAKRGVLLTVFALLIVAGALTHSAKAAANDDAVAFMRELLNRAIEVLNDRVPLADRQERFRQMFHADFDGPRIARLVLGPYWRQASLAEQQQFLKLFENYVDLVYKYAAR
jgi:phospholipid transport system substrate-binding protein